MICTLGNFSTKLLRADNTGISRLHGQEEVRVIEVYAGVDLTFYGNQQELEYDFTVAPQADPRSIQLRFSGAKRIVIDGRGDLILHTAAGEIRHRHPRVRRLSAPFLCLASPMKRID